MGTVADAARPRPETDHIGGYRTSVLSHSSRRVLEDANGKTVVGPNGVEAWIKEDGADVPIHIPSIIPVIR